MIGMAVRMNGDLFPVHHNLCVLLQVRLVVLRSCFSLNIFQSVVSMLSCRADVLPSGHTLICFLTGFTSFTRGLYAGVSIIGLGLGLCIL